MLGVTQGRPLINVQTTLWPVLTMVVDKMKETEGGWKGGVTRCVEGGTKVVFRLYDLDVQCNDDSTHMHTLSHTHTHTMHGCIYPFLSLFLLHAHKVSLSLSLSSLSLALIFARSHSYTYTPLAQIP